jgi:hypothetical protein
MNIDFEHMKTFSILSETPQFVDAGPGNRYVSFLGYVFTYNTFSTLIMWCLCGPNIYYNIWKENNSVEQLKSLNSHDDSLKSMNIDQLGSYFIHKLKENLTVMTASEIEKLLNHMFENKYH